MARNTRKSPENGDFDANKADDGKDLWRQALALGGAGVELAGTLAVLALVGWWLDGKFGTEPWLLLAGAFVGIVGGLAKLYRSGSRGFRKPPDR